MKSLKFHLPFLLILWILPLAVYLKTLAPSILYIDAGAMITGVYTLGIPNPPGFPLYMLVGNLFTKLPFGSVLFRLQLLSIFSALGILTLVYFIIIRFVEKDFFFYKKGLDDKKIFGKIHKKVGSLVVSTCALTGCLALAFSYQFWSQTLNSESYIFTNFLMMIILTIVFTTEVHAQKIKRRAILSSVMLGIFSGANPTIVQVVPTLIFCIILFRKYIGIKYMILMVLLTTVCAFAIYSYLPIRSQKYPFLNWGNPQTVKLFFGHLRGEGLDIHDPRTNSINGFTGSPSIFMQSVGRYLYLMVMQFTPVLLPLVFVGMYSIYRKNKYLFFTFLAIPLTNLLFGGIYLSGNQESWFIASYIIFSLFMSFGLLFCLKLIVPRVSQVSRVPRAQVLLILVVLLIPVVPFVWWFPKLDRSKHVTTEEYARNLYDNLPKNTVLIGSGDFFNSVSLYEHEVVKKRPDVFPVVANMWYILPWYRDNLRHQSPDIMPLQLEKMIKKDRYEEYREVMNWYIEYLINKGYPVFVTPMVFRESVLAGTDFGTLVIDKEKLKTVESGLAYQILTAKDLLGPDEKRFNYKFSNPSFYKNPPFYLERNYNGAYKTLLTEYATSFVDLSDYFVTISRQMSPPGAPQETSKEEQILRKKAIDSIFKAYAFAPFSPEVLNRIGIFSALFGDLDSSIRYFREATSFAPNDLSLRMNLANTLLNKGDLDEAQTHFTFIVDNAQNAKEKQEGQDGLLKVTFGRLVSQTQDFKKTSVDIQGFAFAYPPEWFLQKNGGVTTILSPDKKYTIALYGGIISQALQEEWLQTSPLRFSGFRGNSGPAQIPGFDAKVTFWDEKGIQIMEFILVEKEENTKTGRKHILHIRVGPTNSEYMKYFDIVLSTMKFLN